MCRLIDADESSDIIGDEWLRVPEHTYRHLQKNHQDEFQCREELVVN